MLRQARGPRTIEEFAHVLSVDPDRLGEWETGDEFPVSILDRALRSAGVPTYLLDVNQLLAVAEFTEATKRLLNNPPAMLHRVLQLWSGHGRLIGWTGAMAMTGLISFWTLSNPIPISALRVPVPTVSLPPVAVAPTTGGSRSTLAGVTLPVSGPLPTPAGDPSPTPQANSGDAVQTPAVRPAPSSSPDPDPPGTPSTPAGTPRHKPPGHKGTVPGLINGTAGDDSQ